MVQALESYDDRNQSDGDGCSADCKRIVIAYVCDGNLCKGEDVCGDGLVLSSSRVESLAVGR